MRIFITGGVKSGKSTFALKTAAAFNEPRRFLGTAVAFDDEMAEKIRRHQAERGDGFTTVEEPVEIHRHSGDNLVLDCLTVWMNNILYYKRVDDWPHILEEFLRGLGPNAVIVSNEVGLGNIPDNSLTRRYNTLLGQANVMAAAACEEVYLMVAGCPLRAR